MLILKPFRLEMDSSLLSVENPFVHKRYGDRGYPCLILLLGWNSLLGCPLISIEYDIDEIYTPHNPPPPLFTKAHSVHNFVKKISFNPIIRFTHIEFHGD